ncbi:membrane-spanning 4-domains subfamily A member 6C-like [Odontesthes bonariensis]|uniref:membrane-spanning 4-domains subfamily A member 6C-like n=1 Tax=Odontesthes bonariensis TaxID=219752 RepID=UPI003F589D5D
MSLTMSKADGVTVFTLVSDPQSHWPPLCQIIKSLCFSPVWCSVSQHPRRVLRTSLSVLGVIQILVGLLNIGLGCILLFTPGYSGWNLRNTDYPLWLGALFIVFGIMCILSEKYPSPCLVILNVILNLAGVGFAIAAIVLHSLHLGSLYIWYRCDDDYSYYTPQPSSYYRDRSKANCLEVKEMAMILLKGVSAVLIVLSVLELCVAVSSAVLGIKALRGAGKEQDESSDDPELCKPLLEEEKSAI